ncbi:GNAT family protein [Paenibacillus chibensis]|uniref:GNAT family protein n=1 Tax=Paenibacillus chibensis TaxID=59846 RepID=A0ABU6PSK7_9BACL|nr:GNAT family protein [Paenibacillus chibensis]
MFKYEVNDRTYLSLMNTRDAAELYALINQNRKHIGKWLKFPGMTQRVEDSQAFITRTRLGYAKNEGYWLGIWTDGKLAGSIGFLYLDQENRKTEIGYWLGKAYEGQGLITASVTALIQYALDELNMNKIEIGAATMNTRSRAIPEKLGFKQEGIIRDYEFLNGGFIDRVIYGLKAEEWKESTLKFKRKQETQDEH